MDISTNLLNKYIQTDTNTGNIIKNTNQSSVTPPDSSISLPNVHTTGLSMVNSNLPVSYTKISEIDIPGLKEKASLFKLSNGQKVVILPKKGPTYVRTSFAVGSLNEPDELRGISHFIEHNLFNGSKDLQPGEYDKQLEQLGGVTNAYTSFNETQYHLALQLLDDYSLENAIKLNANQTQFPTFPVEQLEKEKEPVKQEIDMCSDDPGNKAFTLMLKNMFGIQTTSDDLIIGTKENINSLTREQVFDYYNTWYTPDNTITVITGDVDVNETINLVSKYFNKKADISKIQQRKYEPLIPCNQPTRVDFKQNTNPNATISLGFPVEAGTSKADKHKIDILLSLLEAKDSKLSKELDALGLDSSFGHEKLSSAPDSTEVITKLLSLPEEQVEKVLKIIYDSIIDIANNPPSAEDLQLCIQSKLNGLNKYGEYSSDINSLLVQMVKENDLNYFENIKNTLLSLSPQDISDTARKFLDLNKISICVAHPKTVSDEEIINNHNTINSNNNSKTVSFGKSINIKQDINDDINKISSRSLPNNMELSVFPVDNQADAAFNLTIKTDPDDNIYETDTIILSMLLNRGSLYNNNIAYDKLSRQYNLATGFAASQNEICVSASVAPNNIQQAMSLIKQTLLAPNFTQEEFERAKSITKDILLSRTSNPDDKLNMELFPNSNYYKSNEEQLKRLENITLSDIQNLYYKILYNGQANAAIAAPSDEQTGIADIVSGELSQNFPTFKQYVPGKDFQVNRYTPNQNAKILTAVENNAQASIIQSYQYKATGAVEDEAKIMLLNRILGGGMSSRLFDDLRNQEKIAYSVGSDSRRNYDLGQILFYIDTSTDSDITPEASPENINKALNSFKKNVEKIKTENVSQQELDAAKRFYKSQILSSLESNSDKAIFASDLKDNVYGKDYYSKLIDAIDNITVEDIRAAANYVFKDQPVTSIVASQKTFDELKLT